MTEKEIQLLGFQKEIYDEWSDDVGNTGFEYYYHHDITNGLSFISSDSQESGKDDNWYIEIFNTEHPVRFHKFEEVQNLLNILEKHLIK